MTEEQNFWLLRTSSTWVAGDARLREKVRNGQYEFTMPHFFEEMAEDDLILSDIEMAIAKGRLQRKLTRDPRGTRYEIVGPAMDGREIGIICRIKSTGKLLFITAYALG